MKVLVCGGRDYNRADAMAGFLDGLNSNPNFQPIKQVIDVARMQSVFD